jgi:hypothetical protein
MWENVLFWLWKVQKGTSSLHREMERPSKQVAWGEAKFVYNNHIEGGDVVEEEDRGREEVGNGRPWSLWRWGIG